MKGKLIITTLVLAFVMILGFVTNPTYADYKEWYKAEYFNRRGSDITEFERKLSAWLLDAMNDTTTIRKDYKLFSKYTTNYEGNEFEVLGIFNNFFIVHEYNVPEEETAPVQTVN